MLQPFQRVAIDEYEEETKRNKIMTGKKILLTVGRFGISDNDDSNHTSTR